MEKRTILISQCIPEKLQKKLSTHGSLRLLPPFACLPQPVSTHADMLTFAKSGTLYVFEKYYSENIDLFNGLNTVKVKNPQTPAYPDDIALDALSIGKYIVCNEAQTSEEIKKDYKVLNVKQGYAKCSCLKISENAVITADCGIAKTLFHAGIDVLVITSGGIELPGYDYGFIGGASAVTDESVIFFGDLRSHGDYNAIVDFIARQGKTTEYIEGMSLTDYGGATVI